METGGESEGGQEDVMVIYDPVDDNKNSSLAKP